MDGTTRFSNCFIVHCLEKKENDINGKTDESQCTIRQTTGTGKHSHYLGCFFLFKIISERCIINILEIRNIL